MKKKIYLLLLITATAFSVTAQEQKKEEVCYNPNLVKDTAKKVLILWLSLSLMAIV